MTLRNSRMAVLASFLGLQPLLAEPGRTNWPQFRGPGASGVADGFPTPTNWEVEKGAGVRWKSEIPGLAHSSPITWGDKVFVTTAISGDPNPYLKVGLYGESPKKTAQNRSRDRRRRLCRAGAGDCAAAPGRFAYLAPVTGSRNANSK